MYSGKLKELKGMLFPDEYIIKFFFKEKLNTGSGRVLELGSGNGNNLLLFRSFGWDVTGVDIDDNAIKEARHNFGIIDAGGKYEFVKHDISNGMKNVVKGRFDVILLPNILCYIDSDSAVTLMNELNDLTGAKAYFFIRTRTPRDYRYGRGKAAGRLHSFVLQEKETGEDGCLQVFYNEHEAIDMIRGSFAVDEARLRVLNVDFQNIQNNMIISNSDVVIWGRKK